MSDVQINDKKINQLEVKLFVTSMLLQELLDETEGNTKFKHKLRFHINGLQKELDKVLTVEVKDNNLSLFITDAMGALETSIDYLLRQ
jgi:hypothetical protein